MLLFCEQSEFISGCELLERRRQPRQAGASEGGKPIMVFSLRGHLNEQLFGYLFGFRLGFLFVAGPLLGVPDLQSVHQASQYCCTP